MDERPIDCLIVGGGPAGLTAAIYLARYHLHICVVDAGDGRCAMIPRTHNHAGFPGGIPGRELLARMRAQAAEFGVGIVDATVDRLEREGENFAIKIGDDVKTARAVLLATGVVNHRPPIDDAVHDEALERGLLRYCPVCDGYEVTDQRVGVIGTGDHGAREALFLRGFTRDVTLIAPDAEHAIPRKDRARLEEAGVEIADGPCGPLRIDGDKIVADTPAGPLAFDSVYPALGSRIRSRLAQMVDAEMSGDGCLVVDAHQRTSVPGLYAAGDVVKGLDQISHAMGEAGVAATTIRNDLAEKRPVLR
ncbi:NAD(P)/FAD-dependent oxidoreductase [Sphingomonas gilva]|uniref:Thioredoxin reductase n=1 Tax=Sphingomonas gilva TaxID=2305907 RepID=A0A396RS14_9SPHN|nr:NAD(P)/FAD-dependent oxidoreductase [Sphingomonas gilva]RHW17113.1 NAD(P)/FAD-dependent oxidoreductase [Sphingomonas gilva]